jgi:hypothetical protein
MTKTQWAAITSGIHGVTDVGRVLRENTFPTSKSATKPKVGEVKSGVTKNAGATVLKERLKSTNPDLNQFAGKGFMDNVDERSVAEFIKGVLGDSGFEVTGTGIGSDAITITQNKQIAEGKKLVRPSREFNVDKIRTKEGYDALIKEVSDWLNQEGSVDEAAVVKSEQTRSRQGTSTPPPAPAGGVAGGNAR